jgi:hypothetical protein
MSSIRWWLLHNAWVYSIAPYIYKWCWIVQAIIKRVTRCCKFNIDYVNNCNFERWCHAHRTLADVKENWQRDCVLWILMVHKRWRWLEVSTLRLYTTMYTCWTCSVVAISLMVLRYGRCLVNVSIELFHHFSQLFNFWRSTRTVKVFNCLNIHSLVIHMN